jgi:hypothetical protein
MANGSMRGCHGCYRPYASVTLSDVEGITCGRAGRDTKSCHRIRSEISDVLIE